MACAYTEWRAVELQGRQPREVSEGARLDGRNRVVVEVPVLVNVEECVTHCLLCCSRYTNDERPENAPDGTNVMELEYMEFGGLGSGLCVPELQGCQLREVSEGARL